MHDFSTTLCNVDIELQNHVSLCSYIVTRVSPLTSVDIINLANVKLYRLGIVSMYALSNQKVLSPRKALSQLASRRVSELEILNRELICLSDLNLYQPNHTVVYVNPGPF